MADPFAEFQVAHDAALAYRQGVAQGPYTETAGYHAMRDIFAEPLPETGTEAPEVLRDLVARGTRGLTPMTHSRFFGWVLGGSAPAGVAADWLVSAWGQNSAFHEIAPTSAAVEETAAGWLLDILDLPREAAVGFVTGGTVGNFTALAAGRGAVLKRAGWDADADGLFGAPPVNVFLSEDAHTSAKAALGYLGLGRNRVTLVRTDDEGRMRPKDLARHVAGQDGPRIIIAQAGQICTGAFDPFSEIADIAKEAGAWLHVDGAFGLWARAHPEYRGLTRDVERADSWAVDGHKWLQTPFDSGYAIVRDKDALEAAMGIDASYLPAGGESDRVPCRLVPELSRRARGIPTWAMLKTLGRSGVEEMVGRHCKAAARIARGLQAVPGVRVMNDVVLNQIIVSFGDPEGAPNDRRVTTEAMIAKLRSSGLMFVGGGAWRGEWVMRISVISADTGLEDADAVTDLILQTWAAQRAPVEAGS